MADVAASVEFRMQIQDPEPVRRELRGLLQRSGDWSPALEQIADRFREHERQVFATEGGATRSGPWAPLSLRYRQWKERHFPGARIMRRTGALERSLTEPHAPGHVERIEARGLTFGTDLATSRGRWTLGQIQEMGGRGGRLPARHLIDPPEAETGAWMSLLRRHLSGENA